ncbi:hypothetical protein ACIQWZ_27960 [Streptomyces sp. NPDC098077]|uniref:hypothetical protein n=1 Tax=Streptomyces sp. NPDC098077 TaxID=3366093 RepID=UPI0037F8A3C5
MPASETYTTPTQGMAPSEGATGAAQPGQTPAVRPPVQQDTMSIGEEPARVEESGKAAAEMARPAPAESTTVKRDGKKAPRKKRPGPAKKAVPEAPAATPAPTAFTVQQGTGLDLSTLPDERDAWDDFGDFWGAFNPFMASMRALPPEFQEWKEEVIEQYVDSTPPEREGIVEELEEVLPVLTDPGGDTPQPDRYEQLKPTVLPPITLSPDEETPSASV